VHPHAALVEGIDQRRGRNAGKPEADDVGLHGGRVDEDFTELGQAVGEALGQNVGPGQRRPVFTQRVKRTGRDDPGLPEPAAEALLESAGPRDELAHPGQARADRCAEGLGKAHADAVERGGVLALGTACRGRRMP
jgi:hypothetical protein